MTDQIFNEEIRQAIGAHGAWKLKLSAAARTGDTSLPVETLSIDDACAFGKWLRTVAPRMERDPDFKKIREMHRVFHAEAGRLAAMIRDGKAKEVVPEIERGGKFDRQSQELTEAMTNWRLRLKRGG